MSDENQDKIDQAETAARAWLALVDDGDYAAAWKSASAYMRGVVTKRGLRRSLRAARSPLGPVENRTLAGAEYRTSLPGAPDGQYVVIQYSSSFANKREAGERITPVLEPDGQWRVSGYYIT